IAGCARYTATIAARACANVVDSTGPERIVTGFAPAIGLPEAPEPLVVELPHAATEMAASRHRTTSGALAIHGSLIAAQSIATRRTGALGSTKCLPRTS